MKINKAVFFLIIIFLLAFFLRFYKLTEVPNGFNQDESAIGYNAYSILQTGKDEYGKSFPLYFKSFGDQKLPAYIYLTAISESFFGLNEFAVRFPSAALGTLTVLMIYFLVKEISNNKKLSLLTALFLAINPWHLFFSRAAFEDNIALTFALLGVWMFSLAMRSRQWLYLFLSMIGFALSLYSYNVTRLLAPLLFISLVWIHWNTVKHIPMKVKASVILFMVILLLPFLITFFSPAGAVSASGALITSTDIQAKGIEIRSYILEPASIGILGKIFFNKYFFMIWQYLENLVGSLSVNFFFISGSPHGSQGIGNMGVFYLIEFPLILTGIVIITQKKVKKLYFFLLWAIISVCVLSLSKEVPHATRGYFLTVPFEVFSALGFIALIDRVKKIKLTTVRYVFFIGISLLCFYNLVYYFSSYYFRFPLLYASGWRQQDKYVAEYIQLNQSKYDTIIFDNSVGYIYTSLLFFTAYPPAEFQKTSKRAPDDSEGFSYVTSFGKYQWKEVDWEKDSNQPKTLIITSFDKIPENITPIAVFHYPQIPIVLSVKEKIAQYPSQKVAYVAVDTKHGEK